MELIPVGFMPMNSLCLSFLLSFPEGPYSLVIFSGKEGVGVRVKQGLGANAGCDLNPVGGQDPVVPSCSYQIKKDSLQTHRMYRVNPDVSYGL